MPNFASHKGQIMSLMEDVIRQLQPIDISDAEVATREQWLDSNGSPFYGVSIVDQGEQYDDGTIGTQDVGYIIGIIFVKHRTTDAYLADDKIIQWYEIARRRFADQRVLITLGDESAPREHVCIVMPGKTLTDPNKWPNHIIRQLVVVSWIREFPISY